MTHFQYVLQALLAKSTNKRKYKQAVLSFANWLQNSAYKLENGLVWLHHWGPTMHAGKTKSKRNNFIWKAYYITFSYGKNEVRQKQNDKTKLSAASNPKLRRFC